MNKVHKPTGYTRIKVIDKSSDNYATFINGKLVVVELVGLK